MLYFTFKRNKAEFYIKQNKINMKKSSIINIKILHKIIFVSIVISSFALSQSKINVNHLLDYGGIKFMPNSDKPFNGKVFELYDNGAKHWEKRYIRGVAA